jgi:hypothetical protein
MSELAVKHHQTFKRALQDGDAAVLWGIWAEVMPHLPKPRTLEKATEVMHAARTASDCISDRGRCYSHAWLLDHGLPSQLPERLKAKAEQFYPRQVQAVGLSVNFSRTLRRLFPGLDHEVRTAMNGAVEDLAADGADLDDKPVVQGLMFERRDRTLKGLLGTTSLLHAQK